MKFTKVFVVVMVAVLLGVATDGFARNNNYRNSQPKQNKVAPPNKVVSVNAADKTITVEEGKETNVYHVNAFTTIMVNGQKGKLEDVQPGMKVSVTTSGKDTASRIDVDDMPASETPKAKKKK